MLTARGQAVPRSGLKRLRRSNEIVTQLARDICVSHFALVHVQALEQVAVLQPRSVLISPSHPKKGMKERAPGVQYQKVVFLLRAPLCSLRPLLQHTRVVVWDAVLSS